MSINQHEFTDTIIAILDEHTGGNGMALLESSLLLQYLNIKTKAANRGSKSRAGLANHYAIYVLVEDYLTNGFDKNQQYQSYEGAKYSSLLNRQRELPFGSKLQNHALNHRLNEEFHKYFPIEDVRPIIRDVPPSRYWLNERLLNIQLHDKTFNIAKPIIIIISAYIEARKASFNSFMNECSQLLKIENKDKDSAVNFIKNLMRPDADARIFEIVSYAVLKQHYAEKILYWGWSPNKLKKDFLVLYKTGRTNANDGGIDFVMKPLGRFFQVTETIDSGKYFLDIDKIQRYPITFVIKTEADVESVIKKIKHQAKQKYGIEKIVESYINCIECIINIPMLIGYFEKIVSENKVEPVIKEIILQSRTEFNIEDDSDFSTDVE